MITDDGGRLPEELQGVWVPSIPEARIRCPANTGMIRYCLDSLQNISHAEKIKNYQKAFLTKSPPYGRMVT
jgi:hypothetical protein